MGRLLGGEKRLPNPEPRRFAWLYGLEHGGRTTLGDIIELRHEKRMPLREDL